MIRFFDFTFSLIGLILLFPILLILFIIGLFDTGFPLFIQRRMGQKKEAFNLYKFRTMKIGTESVGSHLAKASSVTSLGKFLRASKLDELLQLVNVLKGDMSLVGPRPNLFNQYEVEEERSKLKVYDFLPGITGLAQINNIDMSTPKELAEADAKMLEDFSVRKYFFYIFSTINGKGQGDSIR